MRLHVLAGSGALLRPEPVPAGPLAALTGPRTRPVTAYWFSRHCAPGLYDFLLEPVRDGRIQVLAHALRENFGTRAEPLLVMPGLLDARPPAAPMRAPRAVLREIWSHRPAAELALRALALPEGIDGGDGWAGDAGLLAEAVHHRLDALRAEIGETAGDASISVGVIEPRPEDPGFATVLRNAVAHQVTAQAAPHLAEAGLAAGPAALRTAVAGLLAAWEADGLHPVRPLGSDAMARLCARVLDVLLARSGSA